jgi:F420-dependent oxidoreductase-like protein
MKLAIGAMTFGPRVILNLDLIKHAEKLGFDSAWTAEAYGNDAVTTATWIAAKTETINVGTAIMQMPARTPAMTAMTATSLNQLSGGRFKLGLGPSGPQVVEGFHGVPYGKPLTRTREYIQIVRQIWEREKPLEFSGTHYEIPCKGEGTTGLGKPLKSILHGDPSIPIYTASISPNGLACAAEVADGVIPMMCDPERYDEILKPHLEKGFAKAAGKKSLENFDVMTSCSVIISDDVEQAMMPVKAGLAQYIGSRICSWRARSPRRSRRCRMRSWTPSISSVRRRRFVIACKPGRKPGSAARSARCCWVACNPKRSNSWRRNFSSSLLDRYIPGPSEVWVSMA